MRLHAAALVLAPAIAAPGIANAGPAILLWPADEAAAPASAELEETLADRAGLSPVDSGPIRRRVAEGTRVDPLLFVSEAGRVAETAAAMIPASPESAVEATRGPEREYLADLATETGVRGLVPLAIVRARALAKAGDRTAAQREAMFAVGLDIRAEVDPASLPADARAIWQAALGELAGLPRVEVRIESTPEGARAILDGRVAGRTPVDTELTPGFHVVRVERPGFEAGARIFEVGVDGAEVPPFALRTSLGEPLLEQIAGLVAAGDLALDDADMVALLGAAAQVRYVGVVRRTDAGTSVTIFEPGRERSPGVASGRTAAAVAALIETLTLGAPVRPRGEPPPPPPPPRRDRFYEKWWFWAAAGAVVVGGATTIVVLSQPEPDGVVRWGN